MRSDLYTGKIRLVCSQEERWTGGQILHWEEQAKDYCSTGGEVSPEQGQQLWRRSRLTQFKPSGPLVSPGLASSPSLKLPKMYSTVP